MKVGSLAIVIPLPNYGSSYEAGDIVSFTRDNDKKNVVTHRIVSKVYSDDVIFDVSYLTAGDANKQPDQGKVYPGQIIGKMIFSIPYIGYFIDFVKRPYGFILFVIIPATIIVYEELKKIKRELAFFYRKLRPEKEEEEKGINKVAITVPVIAAAMALTSFSISYFSDREVSSANNFQVGIWVTPTPTPTSTPTISPGDVVINEIMWMGTQGDAADEWIELRNMTSSVIDLSNWVVDNLGSGVTNDIVIPAGKSIAPNGFFLIANDTKETGNHNVDPDLVVNVSLQNPGEQLRLRTSAGGTIIDTADNDGNDWFAGDDPGGQNPEKSMERNDTPGDGTVVSNWHSATIQVNMDPGERELATPRAANSAP